MAAESGYASMEFVVAQINELKNVLEAHVGTISGRVEDLENKVEPQIEQLQLATSNMAASMTALQNNIASQKAQLMSDLDSEFVKHKVAFLQLFESSKIEFQAMWSRFKKNQTEVTNRGSESTIPHVPQIPQKCNSS